MYNFGAMKRSLVVFILLANAVSLAKKNEAPTYDLTGEITSIAPNYKYESHITVGNHTADAYCNTTDTSVNCTDTPVRFYVKFADGSIGAFPPFKPAGQDSEKSCRVTKDKQTGQYHFFPCDPLNELFDARTPQELASHGTVKFQYRLAAMRIWGLVYCVARTDPDGIRKHKETCYGYH